jgi:hypothetical protein
MRRFLTVLLVTAVFGAGCGDDPPTEPTDPLEGQPPLVLSSVFQGSLAPGGADAFFSFSVPIGPSSIRIMLGSVTIGPNMPVTTPLRLGFGVPQGFGCEVSSTVTTASSLAYQLSLDVEAGTYCLNVSDAGSLTGPVDFAARIDANPQIVFGATDSPVTFQSMLTESGESSRTFSPSRNGSAVVTLDAVGPPPTLVVGMGIGIPRADGSGCLLSRAAITPAGTGTLFSMLVETGVYCVKIYDVGNVVDAATFTITIVHPED